jgi:hypothetical protein
MIAHRSDLIHSDRHGALVVPEAVIPDLEGAMNTMFKNEKIVLEPARKDGFNFIIFKQHDWHSKACASEPIIESSETNID